MKLTRDFRKKTPRILGVIILCFVVGLTAVKCNGGLNVETNYSELSDNSLNDSIYKIDATDPDDYARISKSDDNHGHFEDIFKEGNNIYIATSDGGLLIVDTTVKSNPVLKGQYDEELSFNDVYVEGNYAFVDHKNILFVIDITSTTNPSKAGEFTFSDTTYIYDICVKGSYVFVACGLDGLKVLDISTLSNMQVVDTYEDTNNGWIDTLYISGNQLHLGGNGLDYIILDCTTPTSLSLVGNYTPLDSITEIFIDGNHAFLGESGNPGIEIISIITPASPTQVATLSDACIDISVSNEIIFANEYASGLAMYNISDIAHPSLITKVNVSTSNLLIEGDYLYSRLTFERLDIWNISNVTDIVEIGVFYSTGFAHRVAVSGNYAYVADERDGLEIIDISDPINPTKVYSYKFNITSRVYDVYIVGNKLYVAHGGYGLFIFDITNKANPTLLGTYDTILGKARGIAVNGDTAYLANEYNDFEVLDISNPAAVTRDIHAVTMGWCYDLVAVNNFLYVATGVWGMLIYDISVQHAIDYKGTFDNVFGSTLGIAVSGDYAYVADNGQGLRVVDVSDKEHPTQEDQYKNWGYVYDVNIQGDTAYLGTSSGLVILDISDPTALVEIGLDFRLQDCRSAIPKDAFILVASGGSGLQIAGKDSDSDLLADYLETEKYLTDPNNPDTDGDGVIDGIEVILGYDPLDPDDFPTSIPPSLTQPTGKSTLGTMPSIIIMISFALATISCFTLKRKKR